MAHDTTSGFAPRGVRTLRASEPAERFSFPGTPKRNWNQTFLLQLYFNTTKALSPEELSELQTRTTTQTVRCPNRNRTEPGPPCVPQRQLMGGSTQFHLQRSLWREMLRSCGQTITPQDNKSFILGWPQEHEKASKKKKFAQVSRISYNAPFLTGLFSSGSSRGKTAH